VTDENHDKKDMPEPRRSGGKTKREAWKRSPAKKAMKKTAKK
jgi:hypothetical protein